MPFSYSRTSFFIPDFAEIQRQSFLNFLDKGLIREFSKRNPISNSNQNLELFFYPEYYQLSPPEWTPKQAILNSKTYSCRLYVPIQLINNLTKKVKVQWVLIGNLPLMTKRGHFIINGSPRVIINQMVRSPGIYYQESIDKNKKKTYYADLISHRGAWLRIETDNKGRIWARMKKTPKISLLVFLQAMGLTKEKIFQSLNYSSFLKNSFLKENHPSSIEEALIALYSKTHQKKDKEEITADMGQKFLSRKFFNSRTYDLGELGRIQLNNKLGLSVPTYESTLTAEDILFVTDYLIKLEYGIGAIDDIDHLKNRRVRASGELIQNQLGTGLIRLEKIIREKLKKPQKNLSAGSFITTKPLNGALREFFGSSPLSQFMDQTNPLAEITHKRRLSSLGPGGISRETAGMAVRGIHPSHYGRICPIETPEGPNAGLVNSITIYAKISSNGFIKTPLYNVYQGQVQKNGYPIFFSAEQEESINVAPGDLKVNSLHFLPKNIIPIRAAKEFKKVYRDQVEYIAISPLQMISIATSLIPFLEHNDANRALMGSNMQRQAVPLISPQRPIVGTGLEARVALDSGHVIQAKTSGLVYSVSAEKIIIQNFYLPVSSLDKNEMEGLVLTEGNSEKQKHSTAFTKYKSISKQLPKGNKNELINLDSKWKPFKLNCLDHTNFFFDQPMILKKKTPFKNKNIKNQFNFNLFKSSNSYLIKNKKTIFSPTNKLISSNKLEISVASQFEKLGFSKLTKTTTFYKQPALPVYWQRLYFVDNSTLSLQENANHYLKVNFPPLLLAPRKQKLALPIKKTILTALYLKNKFSLNTNQLKFSTLALPERNLENQDYFLDFLEAKKSSKAKSNSKIFQKISLKYSTYFLQNYNRSNQDTCLTQRPVVREGEWVQKGDLLADGAASVGGELSLGKTILIAYMPWEGYNFEDAILISERLLYDDVYTSIHIEKYEIEIRDTKFGIEQITDQLPEVDTASISHLDTKGIAKIGSWVKEGDILVGKITPILKKSNSLDQNYENLMNDIHKPESQKSEKKFEKMPTIRDTSLRVPKGVHGRIIDIQILETENVPLEINFEGPGRVQIYVAEKRKIQVGDKMAGRHGNKGIVSKILPRQDMPYLPDGTPVDMVLNPLGVPSRMNVGQVFECLLGLAGKQLNQQFKILPFDEIYGPQASRSLVYSKLFEARIKTKQNWLFNPEFPGKTKLFDGRTGECFDQAVTVGQAYMLKLVHLVDEKIHARSTGPYSLVTQQPLRGRSKHGGQRLGEMEVWALEGFGAAYTLQELLTLKSDDMKGRHQVMSAIVDTKPITSGTPESFKVLLRELQSLCLDVGVYTIDSSGKRKQIDLMLLS
uniref:DNA-directed RNA polymerase subunit beta n=1 Tax=Edaphochlorella mirabilis TaxID=3083 RepID=A0A097KKQ6_9CHLO|nr:beta subunit of RNA polymerase [Edaphochlorella mirabilis]AIT93774.1 beta subunit of RNA polymerase [Edaphochlorella mirabilis]